MDFSGNGAMVEKSDLHAPSAVLTSHVLDMGTGMPGRGIPITLLKVEPESAHVLAKVVTNADGRCDAPLLTTDTVEAGAYRLEFDVGAYHGDQSGFFGTVPIEFQISDVSGHYHVPLVLAPWGYSTYRGAPPARPPNDGGHWNCDLGKTDDAGNQTPAAPPGSAPPGMTTHVIDIARGGGAGGLAVDVVRFGEDGGSTQQLRTCHTTPEGRTSEWLVPAGGLEAGDYELVFHLGDYFAGAGFGVGPNPFFSVARVRFRVSDPGVHHHIPILAAPWGYTTYRGS